MRRRHDPGALSDAEAVQRVLDGSADTYQVLVQRHQEAAFRLCRALVHDAETAADLVQDAFVRAYVNLARCSDPDRFGVWLMRIARNRAYDHLRERRRGDVSLSDEKVARRVDAGAHVAGDEDRRLAERDALERALARLSAPLREAFVLRHVEQLSTAEVAALLGTGESAVKMRVQRARLQLQQWLDAEERDDARDVTRTTEGSSDE